MIEKAEEAVRKEDLARGETSQQETDQETDQEMDQEMAAGEETDESAVFEAKMKLDA